MPAKESPDPHVKGHKPRNDNEESDKNPSILNQHGYHILQDQPDLGRGSFATVKRAYSEQHKCNVAIKIITKRDAPEDYLRKFLPREIKVVFYLKHPNLVIFYQSIETNTRVYFIMEEAVGGNLLELIHQRKRIPERLACSYFRQMLNGVEYIHSRGVVHRDLKCENILLNSEGSLKIIDFGFARTDMLPVDGMYKRSETFCGSYAYAAPEILMGIAYIPQLADIWSMGVILYVMVIGRLPFDDSNYRKLLSKVLNGPDFPPNRESTAEFKETSVAILKREEMRPTIQQIRALAWYTLNVN